MRKQVAILLLFCYASVLLKPLYPCVQDLLAHTFWEAEHVAQIHFENGKYHLHVELKKNAGENSSPVSQNESKKAGEENASHLKSTAAFFTPALSFSLLTSPANEALPLPVSLGVSPPPPWQA